MNNLSGTRVLVVGGSSGIGLSCARAAAREGADVTIASRSASKLETAVATIGGNASSVRLDATDADAVADFLASMEFHHIVVSCAAMCVRHIHEMPLEDARASLDSKFWAAFNVARAARFAGPGSLALIGGARATRPARGAALVSAINAAIEGLVRGLALELAPVRVNGVAPSSIVTPLLGTLSDTEIDTRRRAIAASLPVGISGEPEHVATQVLALMRNPFMTGEVVHVDGGARIA